MNQLRIHDLWEFFLFKLLVRWEQTAPPDRHKGELDGVTTFNAQEARLTYVLKAAAVGHADSFYRGLARYTRRVDGNSYISQDQSWMGKPHPLLEGWYVEGCQSLKQRFVLLDNLTKLGFSPEFEECAKDFVEGRSIEEYLPTYEELKEMFMGVPGCNFKDLREAA